MARATEKTRKLVQMAILIAVMLILAFTPLGYLKVGAIEITFMTIPVVRRRNHFRACGGCGPGRRVWLDQLHPVFRHERIWRGPFEHQPDPDIFGLHGSSYPHGVSGGRHFSGAVS